MFVCFFNSYSNIVSLYAKSSQGVFLVELIPCLEVTCSVCIVCERLKNVDMKQVRGNLTL